MNLQSINYEDISFVDCEFNNNTGATGLMIMGRSSLTNVDITGCVATGNSTGISLGNNITDMTVAETFLAGNTSAGLVNWTDSGAVLAENNWWGNATGPSNATNPGGTGAAVIGTVDFNPWLGYGTDTDELAMGFQPDISTVLYAPVGVAFVTQPVGNVNLGVALSQQPVVMVTNETGNVATQFTGNVTLAFGANLNGGVLNGTLMKAAVAGVATFTDLNVKVGGGSGFTLAASAASPILGAESAAFDIANLLPSASSLSPYWTRKGHAAFPLSVSGADFVAHSVVQWNGTNLVTTYVSATEITAAVPADYVAEVGTALVTVFNPTEGGGGGTSGALTFRVEAATLDVVYADDSYVGLPDNTLVDWPYSGAPGAGTRILGYDVFVTIQAAVTAVNAAGAVNVAAGLYGEDIRIDKDITLLGPQSGTSRNTGIATDWTSSTTAGWTAQDAQAAGEAVIRSAAITGTSVISIDEPGLNNGRTDYDVTIKGFVIEARNRTDGTNVHLIYVAAKDADINTFVLENNIIGPITGTAQDGKKGRMGIDLDSQINGNNGLSGSIKGNKIFGAEGDGNNVFIIGNPYFPSMSDYSRMVIEQNDIYGANRAGLEICNGISGLTVRNNAILYSGFIWDGATYVRSANSLLQPDSLKYGTGLNLIRGGTEVGKPLAQQNYLENFSISGNQIKNNQKMGIYAESNQKNLSIVGNDLLNNGRDGIWLDESGTFNTGKTYQLGYGYMNGVSVSNNMIAGAAETYAAVRITGKPQGVVLTGNSLADNAVGVVQYDGDGQTWDFTANASGNWFGSVNAADVRAAANGGVDVDYTPWLAVGDTDGGAVGFKGDFAALWVDDDSVQVGTTGRVQEGVNLATAGGTVNVLEGTYIENVTVGKRVSVIGTGRGDGGTVLASAAGDNKIGVVNLTGSGLSDAGPMLFKDLLVSAVGRSGFSVGRFTESTGQSVDFVKLDNVRVIGSGATPCTEQERGLYVDPTSSLQHLVVSGCAFNTLHYGWYIQKVVSADASTVRYVTVTDTTFNDNATKGIYAEKLSDATFTGCEVAGNGSYAALLSACNYFAPWMSGIDINLKAGTYANLSFIDCAITDNALGGAKEGVGITIKARDDGATYGANPATCTDVLISGCTITGNERGVRIGEPGKNNATPTGVVIEDCMIAGNVQQYNGSDGSAYGGLINMTSAAVPIHADNNWWGDMTGPAIAANPGGTGDAVTANVAFSPWYGDDMTTLYYTPSYLVFSKQPQASGGLNAPLSQQPVVQVINENDEVALQYTGPVYLAIGVNPGSGTLSGSTNLNCIAGVATFDGLAVTVGGGSGLTLVASTTSPILGATSAAFDVANPVPTAGSLSPYWIRAGHAGDVTVTVTGTGFTPTSIVRWNPGSGDFALTTTYVSANTITAVIPEAYLTSVGSAAVTVFTPAAGGGTSTPPLVFRIEDATPDVVYVDDGYAGATSDDVVNWPVGTTTVTGRIINYDAFATIQDAMEAVTAGGTVNVAAGTYAENVVINKAVALFGPNAGKLWNDPARGPEAVVCPGSTTRAGPASYSLSRPVM